MRIIKKPSRNKESNRKLIFIFSFITYSSIIFIAGALSYREGLVAKYQSILIPFSKNFRVKPIKTLINQIRPVTPLVIDIDYLNNLKINETQKRAVKLNQLFPKEDDWVNANLSFGSEKYKAKIRLKGQLNEHWQADRLWSYKIKIDEDKTFLGMDRFALQHPRTRSFMNEWYYHKLLNYAGLISLRYKFIPLIINGKNMPIYAIEENFSTRLLENNNKREGPIFRLQNRESPEEPYVNQVTFYQTNKYKSTDHGRYLLRRVERQVSKFLNGELKAKDIFEIKSMAKAYAISDVFGHDHPILAYNMRYYLNPISGLIEPIPYDQQEIKLVKERGLIGERNKHYKDTTLYSDKIISYLFRDKEFSREYGKALNKFSKKDWLDEFFKSTEIESKKALSLLQKSFIRYEFNQKEILYANQNYINSRLRERSPLIAYLLASDSNNQIYLKLNALHTLPIEIKYLETFEGEKINSEIQPKLISNRLRLCNLNNCKREIKPIEDNFEYVKISLNNKNKSKFNLNQLNLIGSVLGSSFNFSVPIYSYKENETSIKDINQLRALKYLNINEDSKIISFKRNSIRIKDSLFIPSGYQLKILPGTSLDLIENASIISYSPLSFIGTAKLPIEIISSDGNGQGIVVVNAKRTSTLKHISFKNLKTIYKYGINPSGSITFYNSDVEINNASFESLKSEDSLNIINSKFIINDSEFNNSLSDAIDIDFSNGSMNNLKLTNIGNDGLDFSGSGVSLKNILINNSGDKGISIGENSSINMENINIIKSLVGIAVKDDSLLKGENILINNTYVGIANYNKKSWFKGAKTLLKEVIITNTNNKYLNEIGSIMNINNFKIEPNQTNLLNKLYNKF
tara:strand:+ start:5079 stop:7649 length:2571 start_codon:yes stop_codon:yes gene_type:complete